ncbi:Lipoprotein-releasing system transmembrane protein LolC [compost metagenome]
MLVAHLFRHFIFSKRAGALVKRIAWLAMVGIGLSTTAFLVVLFVMNGMNASIKSRILGLEPQLNVTVADITSPQALEVHPVMQRLKDVPDTRAYVFESQDVIIRSQDGQFRGGIARGVSPESLEFMIQQLQRMDQKKKPQQEVDSAFFWNPEDIPGESEIVMGIDLAQSLGVFEGDFVTVVSPEGLLLPPGETPKFERVRIKRIIATSIADLDAQYLFYQRGKSLVHISDGYSKRLGIEVFAPESVNLEDFAEDLQKFDGVQVETWMQRNSALFYALKLEKLTIGVILALAGMIASIAIVTVLVLLLSQKRRDIAILRTIGLSGRQTVHIFTKMGLMLAGSGLGAGIILGTIISYYIQENPVNFLPAEIYYDSTIPAQVDPSLIFGVIVVGALVALGGSYIPSRAALEEEPSQALRSK